MTPTEDEVPNYLEYILKVIVPSSPTMPKSKKPLSISLYSTAVLLLCSCTHREFSTFWAGTLAWTREGREGFVWRRSSTARRPHGSRPFIRRTSGPKSTHSRGGAIFRRRRIITDKKKRKQESSVDCGYTKL